MDWEWRAPNGEMTLLQFLKERCKQAPSIKAIKRAIDDKMCCVNGTIETFSSSLLNKGDRVTLDPSAFLEKAPKKITVLYEDDGMIVLNKPSGLLSDVADLQVPSFYLVHRLDKETSGVLIVAKTKTLQTSLETLFKEHLVQKLYLAVVDGKMEKDSGIIENFLGKKGEYAGQTIYGSVAKEKGKRAETHFRCIDKNNEASLVACEPKTGRTHQIRVHLSSLGHPILGDRQYAKKFCSSFCPKRNLLHAYQLIFKHPVTGKTIKIIAPIPSDFQEAILALHLSLGKKR